MGTSSSKQRSKQNERDPVLHYAPMPITRDRVRCLENGINVPWKPTIPELLGSGVFCNNRFGMQSIPRQVCEEDRLPLELKPDHITGTRVFRNDFKKSLRGSVSVQPTIEFDPHRKSCLGHKGSKVPLGEVPRGKIISHKVDPILEFLPHKDTAMFRSAGLRSLLNPVLLPSHGFASQTRYLNDPNRTLSLRSLDAESTSACSPKSSTLHVRSSFSNNKNLKTSAELVNEKSGYHIRSSSISSFLTQGSIKLDSLPTVGIPGGSDTSPLFDPLLLASFEKALECVADNDHQTFETLDQSDESQQNSDSNMDDDSFTASESESGSDVEYSHSIQADIYKNEELDTISFHGLNISINSPIVSPNALLRRNLSFSRVLPLKHDENWSGKDYLSRFQILCPPCGEKKVVLYFTTLRAVRRTFENSYMIRTILKRLRIHADERDVWMHSKFRKELTETMGSILPVPRLFILGRYIGGAEEVEQLHEEGILEKMLEGLATCEREECQFCADIRFIPCTTCWGSCKLFSDGDLMERCPDCNENGLMMCPYCN